MTQFTTEVFYLNWDMGGETSERVMDFMTGMREGAELDLKDLVENYRHVGTESFSVKTPEEAASTVWPKWNRGSGQESEAFHQAQTRSLNVGDVLEVSGPGGDVSRFMVASIGFEPVEL